MPSNEQRRATAKRKLERQLANRAQRARRRKQLTVAGSILGVIVVAAAGVGIYYLTRGEGKDTRSDTVAGSSAPVAPAPSARAKPAMVTCSYADSAKPADKQVSKPTRTEVPTTGDKAQTVSLSVDTSQGSLGLTLNNAESPCTVNSFVSLVSQGYFDNSPCHRMTAIDGLKVLQCGDPTGSGTGGPGYQFADEYPADQYAPGDPAAQEKISYKRGTIAMANAGPGTNGSQFFLVYQDSQLPPLYTIFGKVDDSSMATLDKIAKIGEDNSNGPGDGKPKQPVTIQSVRVD
ncbi:peptidylprolyl isomerase [Nocardia panacis]|uniref:Peptidyl-prolyl cis-trans isomerase n=1 Tax=Nocardia panacis TaxID=2340916 RepID=A0A3A4K2Y8_9NOCA|nr:peptidylprolyl isomerase [Nocardia panacis]RJO68376.1 peptidylprolyl isomerase [Nocardia panacis]